MLVVTGRFRFPAEHLAQARLLMRDVIAATLHEHGCRAYSYAEDVTEAGLFRVHEEWENRAALARHFETPHMRQWIAQRESLGFHDREIMVYEVAAAERL